MLLDNLNNVIELLLCSSYNNTVGFEAVATSNLLHTEAVAQPLAQTGIPLAKRSTGWLVHYITMERFLCISKLGHQWSNNGDNPLSEPMLDTSVKLESKYNNFY